MRFLTVPQDFTPIADGLCFGFATDEEPREVVVEVVDVESDEVVGRKVLCDISEGEVDIAPYVERLTAAGPATNGVTCLDEAPHGVYAVAIDGERSPAVVISRNRVLPIVPSWLSTMPQNRDIAHGEADELALFVPAGAVVAMHVESDGGEVVDAEYVAASGAVVACVATADFSRSTRRLEVGLSCNGEPMLSLYYNVVAGHRSDVRLVWLSDAGTVERYTFPTMQEMSRSVVRQRIVQGQLPVAVDCLTEQRVRLISRYESRAVAAALAEIVSSPRVWCEVKGVVSEVDVVSVASTLYSFARPDSVEVELRLWRKEVGL